MGVPGFFRWLSSKYPSVIVHCIEEKSKKMDGKKVPVDTTAANPNGIEFDNLYLDMTGMIHRCTHPEDKPAPKSEDKMMVAIFECIDRVFRIVRPRRLLYIAIDGVAPRAKMNQQRSCRFRTSKESCEKQTEIERVREELISRGLKVLPEKPRGNHFDSNCITPGTSFMDRLSKCLHYYIHDRLNTDPGWKVIQVILSDASVPGEGEHKIMDYIRRQRAMPHHDPNTKHVVCGDDADLIMLGLAVHELNFTIIREEFKPNNPWPCDICGQLGHEVTHCLGIEKEAGDDVIAAPFAAKVEFIFVRLNVLREYLERELSMPKLPFPFDLDRVIDDWVFMCFLVGNDILPHLPSLEIRENAIDRLVALYKKCVYKTGGYVTNSGIADLNRIQLILSELGKAEDTIFKQRQRSDLLYEATQKSEFANISMDSTPDSRHSDTVRLWQNDFKDRYYQSKFSVSQDNIAFRYEVGKQYVIGLCWVLRYYYQGCSSWEWYYPYHYAPFASDFVNIRDLKVDFPLDTKPLTPLEQLMSVFPAASKSQLPEPWGWLMCDRESEIIDFYPKDFQIDLNGKKYSWQGVALLPFVDEKRLKAVLTRFYHLLTEEERRRNICGDARFYLKKSHQGYDFLAGLYENSFDEGTEVDLDPSLFQGMSGTFSISSDVVAPRGVLTSPVNGLLDVIDNDVIIMRFRNRKFEPGYFFQAVRLKNAIEPPRVLKPQNLSKEESRKWRPTIGMVPSTQRAYLDPSAHRMLARLGLGRDQSRAGNGDRLGHSRDASSRKRLEKSRSKGNKDKGRKLPEERREDPSENRGTQQPHNSCSKATANISSRKQS